MRRWNKSPWSEYRTSSLFRSPLYFMFRFSVFGWNCFLIFFGLFFQAGGNDSYLLNLASRYSEDLGISYLDVLQQVRGLFINYGIQFWGFQPFPYPICHACYSAVTCKVLLNWPHNKLGQYCVDSLPNLGKHIARRCESIAFLLRNSPSFEQVGIHLHVQIIIS